MLKEKLTIVAILIAGLISTKGVAQGSCTQTLREAQLTYDRGRIDLVSDILAPCLETGFNKEEKINAYKLLVNTYLYFNERGKAEESMTSFLKLNPEYKIDTVVDQSEFINLYNSFRTKPIYLIGAKAGGNINAINVTKNFSLDDASIERGTYEFQLGFQLGIAAEIPLYKGLSIAPELYFEIKRFQYTDSLLNFAYVDYQETQTWVEMPLTLRYNYTGLRNPNIIPYIDLGATGSYLINADASVVREDNVGDESQREVSGPSISVTELRSKPNYGVTVGGGVKLKNFVGTGFFMVDFRYTHGLTNVVNPDKRTSNTELLYDYLYIDNDFQMNTYAFSIGYALPQYKPKVMRKKSKKLKKKDLVSEN